MTQRPTPPPSPPVIPPSGPTLRQQYAMAAMQGLLIAKWHGVDVAGRSRSLPYSPEENQISGAWLGRETLAADAFAIADAMLAHEANKKKD